VRQEDLYASEVNMLRKILETLENLPRIPFIADKGYDAVDVIERLIKFGCEPAIGMKQTWRMRIRNSLRRISFENWEKYKKKRYRIEGGIWFDKIEGRFKFYIDKRRFS
jgi:hypothetical protein